MQHFFLLLLRFQNKLKGNQQQHLFNISLTLTGTSGDAGGKELEKRLSKNVFSSLSVHLADIIIFGNVLLLKAFAVTRYEVINDRKPCKLPFWSRLM